MIQSSQLNTIFKAEEYSMGLIDKLINSFLIHVEENVIYIPRLSEITTEHCSLILKFALTNPEEFGVLLSHLYKRTSVSCQEITDVDGETPFGIYLLTKFADPIVHFAIDNFEKFLQGSDDVELIVKMTSYLMKYLERNKDELQNDFKKVSKRILAKWFLFEMYFEENSIDLGKCCFDIKI